MGQPPNASEYAATKAALQADTPADAAAFLARWQPTFATTLPYDPSAADNLDLIQASTLKLNDIELGRLSTAGFALSPRQSFGTFFMGYVGIYANDLPLFISGDSVLHAVHRSYDAILEDVENAALQPALLRLLAGMRTALSGEMAGGAWPAETLADVDEYLAVALKPGRAGPDRGAGRGRRRGRHFVLGREGAGGERARRRRPVRRPRARSTSRSSRCADTMPTRPRSRRTFVR